MYCHTVSDHTPIKISFKCKIKRTVDKDPPAFKFNTSFLKDPKFCEELKGRWIEASTPFSNPLDKWRSGMSAITELAKARGRAKAKTSREGRKGLEHALKCTRLATNLNP